MKNGLKQGLVILLSLCLSLVIVKYPIVVLGEEQDEFDLLRDRYDTMLTGGDNYDLTDDNITNIIESITDVAQSYWETMTLETSSDFLWDDIQSTTLSADIYWAYYRLEAMATSSL